MKRLVLVAAGAFSTFKTWMVMNAFRVSIDGAELILQKGMAPSTNRQALIGSNHYWSKSSSLSLDIDCFAGLDYSIVVLSAISRQTASLQFQCDTDLFVMPIAWSSSMILQMVAGEKRSFKNLQYNLFNISGYTMELSSALHPVESIILGFNKNWLAPYARYCLKLAAVLEVNPGIQLHSLMQSPQFLSIDEISLLHRILGYEQAPALAANYYSSLLHVFMVAMVKQVNSLLDAGACDPLDLEKAAKVRDIILADFEIYHTVEALARMVRMAEMKLQLAFKQLYGTTVMNFSRDARLEKGYECLTTTDYPLRVVCMMVGYDDPSNFSCAFKKKYGYWPGYIRKSTKQTH